MTEFTKNNNNNYTFSALFLVHSLIWIECTLSSFGFAVGVVLQDTSLTAHLASNG